MRFGAVLGAIINFAIVAAVVYFVFVMPMNHLKERAEAKRKAGTPDRGRARDRAQLLSEIRDLLAERSGAGTPAAARPSAASTPSSVALTSAAVAPA